MAAIFKYTLPLGLQPCWHDVPLPARAEILRVGSQNDEIVFWALVDPADSETRRLGAFPTGWSFGTEQPLYIGSTEVYAGTVVVHVFEDVGAANQEEGS